MNKVVLIGRMTKDPELKFTPGSGTAVTSITVAIDRKGGKDKEKKETDFVPVVIWGKQAEATANYMSKGKLIGIAGRLQTRSYEDKQNNKRFVMEVVADEVQFLEWPKDKQGKAPTSDNEFNFGDDVTPVDDGDIPF